MTLAVRLLSLLVIVACGLVVVAVVIFLPELIADWAVEPEGLIGTSLLGLLAFAIAAVLIRKLGGQGGRWVRSATLFLAVIAAGSGAISLLSGDWLVTLILLCVAMALAGATARQRTKSRQT